MRAFTLILLMLHASIHLLGFVKEWRLAPVTLLAGRTLFVLPEGAARWIGLLWLATCLLLVSGALLLLLGRPLWWQLVAAGIVLSQLLVVYAWPDAKAGTIANSLLLVCVLLALGRDRFQRADRRAVAQLSSAPEAQSGQPVQAEQLATLPPAVRNWLLASNVLGRPPVQAVRLRQHGLLRGTEHGAFMAVQASQYFRVDPPGFVWCADVTMMRALPLSGRDSYLHGKGKMLISLAGLIPLVDVANAKISEGTLQRFLAELVWFPGAALSPKISWSGDERRAEARLLDQGVEARASFTFDEQGRFQELSALRYKDSGPEAQRLPWLVTASAWRELAGSLVPSAGEVKWRLPSGDLTVYRWTVDELELNPDLSRLHDLP